MGPFFLWTFRLQSGFEPIELCTKRFRGGVYGGFEGTGLLFGKQVFPRHADPDLHGLISHPFIVETQENFPAHQPVIKGMELVHPLLNEVNQFPVGVEVNRMNS